MNFPRIPIPNWRPVAKGVAGAVGGMLTGNTGAIVMNPDQIASMPWYGVVISNAVYAAIGFIAVYVAPANSQGPKHS